MEIIKTIKEMQAYSKSCTRSGLSVGCVPTMGFLHEGHTSLMLAARAKADRVVTTLFVNPTQFGPNEDFEQYPRDFEKDSRLAEENGTDVLFAPEVGEMYDSGKCTTVSLAGFTGKFEGSTRPTHFDGVALVVSKLFNIVLPDIAVFGQKDYQQTLVIRRMVRDLNFPIEIIIARTIREADGLAKSSRNTYLSPQERTAAPRLHLALSRAAEAIRQGQRDRRAINRIIEEEMALEPLFRLDYGRAAHALTLCEPDCFGSGDEIVLLAAAFIGKTRLIDNELISI